MGLLCGLGRVCLIVVGSCIVVLAGASRCLGICLCGTPLVLVLLVLVCVAFGWVRLVLASLWCGLVGFPGFDLLRFAVM